ncbi:hypothetical protein MJO29_015159 [Puccinia striiformis f. sp. tritici]|nr:hypothetical protein MJO29_015159 [Puccinia striiformis f. sp. tritici]
MSRVQHRVKKTSSSTSNKSIVSETLSAAFSKSATSLDAKIIPKGFDHPAKELQSAVTETTSTFVSHSGSGIEPTTCYPVPSPSADQPSVSKDHTPAHTESPSANPVTHSEPRIEPKSSFLKSSRSASTPSALTDTTKTDSISLAGYSYYEAEYNFTSQARRDKGLQVKDSNFLA